jgi:ankyrin repeat protein
MLDEDEYDEEDYDEYAEDGPMPPLVKAAMKLRLEEIRKLLEAGADVDQKGGMMEYTALHVAVDTSIIHRDTSIIHHIEVVRLLIQHGANVSAKARGGTTPLHVAVNHWRDSEAMMRLLLQNGADVEAKDWEGATPLHVAAYSAGYDGSPFIGTYEGPTRALLENGADATTKTNDGLTPLHIAVGRGIEPMVRQLLQHGVFLNATTKHGETALHFAAGGGDEQLVLLLLEKGADDGALTTAGETPLFYAAYRPGDAPLAQAYTPTLNLKPWQ